MLILSGKKFNIHQTEERILIEHPGSCAIVAVTKNGHVVLINQKRIQFDGSFIETIEIPAGILDVPDEDHMSCAIRELEEETGYKPSGSSSCFHLTDFVSTCGYSNEIVRIFWINDVEYCGLKKEQNIENKLLSKDSLVNLLETKTITDGKTLAALALVLLKSLL